MDALKICMLAVLGLAVTSVLRGWRADWLPLVRVALVVGFGLASLSLAEPIVVYLQALTAASAIAAYAPTLFKALAIAFITQYAAEICRESGESGAASGVELAGKLEILLLSLPLVGELLQMAESLLSMGGVP